MRVDFPVKSLLLWLKKGPPEGGPSLGRKRPQEGSGAACAAIVQLMAYVVFGNNFIFNCNILAVTVTNLSQFWPQKGVFSSRIRRILAEMR